MLVRTWADGFGRWHAVVSADVESADAAVMADAARAAITAEVHERSSGSPAALAFRADVVPVEGPTFEVGRVTVTYREWFRSASDTPTARAVGARSVVTGG